MRASQYPDRPSLGRRLEAAALGLLAGALLLAAAPAAVRGAGLPDGAKRERFERLVFPPQLVMASQAEIGLGEDQRRALIAELQSTQSDLVPLQVEISEAGEMLAGLLAGERVDEVAAVSAAGRVMDLEAEIKQRHLAMLIRVKNLLSAEQQERLRAIRAREAGGGVPGR